MEEAKLRAHLQVAEALGEINRWYCSQKYGRQINEADVLLTYFIRSGGAEDFAERFNAAMGPLNRWFCSEYYGREIADPLTLWEYYTTASEANAAQILAAT